MSIQDDRGSLLPVDRLSFGQRRLLSLLYYLEVYASGTALLDEPTNGLHYSWIEDLQEYLTRPGDLVVFHLDGDCVWNPKGVQASDNLQHFQDRLLPQVEHFLMNPPTIRRKGPTALNDQQARAALDRLIVMMPIYSIEAWLFQNFQVLEGKAIKAKDRRNIEHWKSDRTLLDRLSKPKEQLSFGDKHNQELATTKFPGEATYKVGQSFTGFVDSLRLSHGFFEFCQTVAPKWAQTQL